MWEYFTKSYSHFFHMEDDFNVLGLDRWELVCVITEPAAHLYSAFFKRPKIETNEREISEAPAL